MTQEAITNDRPRCAGVRTSGHWKGSPCCAVPTVEYGGMHWCKNHLPVAGERAKAEGIARRAELYNAAFPNRPGLLADAGMVVGTWMIGACYKNPNPLYGAYPKGYLERVHAMFPEARRVLHAFSGGLTYENAKAAHDQFGFHVTPRAPARDVELVDLKGPEDGRHPTWQGDLHDFCELPDRQGRFDLILADPPYSAGDAEKYGVPMVNRGRVMRSLRKVAARGANLVWLDQVWPMHRKDEWRTWGTIGLVRSTNHRVRMVSMFEVA